MKIAELHIERTSAGCMSYRLYEQPQDSLTTPRAWCGATASIPRQKETAAPVDGCRRGQSDMGIGSWKRREVIAGAREPLGATALRGGSART